MNNIYVITGATGGMGSTLARRFKDKGDLVLCDLNEELLLELQKELGVNNQIIVGSVTEEDVLNKIFDKVKEMGRLKGIIHFAGVSETFGNPEKIMEINLVGTAKLVNKLEPLVTDGTIIINTASMTAYSTHTNEDVLKLLENPLDENFISNISKYLNNNADLAYGLSKKGVMLLSKTLAPIIGQKGGRIISISPGVIKTPMVEREMAKNSEAINNLISMTPVKRIGTASDIVNLIEFLCSDQASFITGTDILIDGGVTGVFEKIKHN